MKNLGPRSESSQAGGARPRETGDSSGTRPWFMPRMLKPRSLKYNSGILKDVTRDFTSTEIDLAKELEKDKQDGKKPSET